MGDIGNTPRWEDEQFKNIVKLTLYGDDDHKEKTKNNRKKVESLSTKLHRGSLLFPMSHGYEYSVLVGNLRYRLRSPLAVVHAVTAEDVMETVKFCVQKNLKLTVRTGGHSNAAHCLNDEGIVLDMRMLNRVVIHSSEELVYVGGGAIWKDVYRVLHDKNRRLVVVGGQCPNVGVGGFLLGGGMSPFSRSYGLGIDNIEAIDVVKANGEMQTVSAKIEPDLFWALRGGGGGNFGIATGFYLKTHMLEHEYGKVTCGTLGWLVEKQKDEFTEVMEKWRQATLPKRLCGDALWRYRTDPADKKKKLWAEITIIFNGDKATCDAELKKFLPEQYVFPDKYPAIKGFVNKLTEMEFLEWEVRDEAFGSRSKVHHHHCSVIIEKGDMTREVVNLITEWMEKIGAREPKSENGGCHVLWDHIGGQTREVEKGETAFPWRTGEYALSLKTSWEKEEEGVQMIGEVQRLRDSLRRYAISTKAAYVNFIDNTLDDWADSYYGDNHQRLRELKTKYDPYNFFEFEQSIRGPDRDYPKIPNIPPHEAAVHNGELRDNENSEESAKNSNDIRHERGMAEIKSPDGKKYANLQTGRPSAVPLKRYILDL